ncbi:hypothetical protein IGI49_002609 [Enterococcus sp. AZ071]
MMNLKFVSEKKQLRKQPKRNTELLTALQRGE